MRWNTEQVLTAKIPFWLFGGYLLILVMLATLPINSSSELTLNHTFVIHIRLDHLLHGIMMLPWMILGIISGKMRFTHSFVAGILMSVFLEGIQFFLPYRAYNINDMISNFIGFFLGVFVLFLYKSLR